MKQTCDICLKTRKGKHFGYSSSDVVWCDKCVAKCPPPASAGTRWHPALKINMPLSKHLPFYLMNRADWPTYGFHPGVITQGAPLNPPTPPTKGSQQAHQLLNAAHQYVQNGTGPLASQINPTKPKAPPKPRVTSQDGVHTPELERLKLQLKAGLDHMGAPLKDDERAAIEKRIEVFETPPDDDEEAAAIASILGKDTP